MTQIKEDNQENQLWQGFKVSVNPKTNEKHFTPTLMIFKYKTKMFDGEQSDED